MLPVPTSSAVPDVHCFVRRGMDFPATIFSISVKPSSLLLTPRSRSQSVPVGPVRRTPGERGERGERLVAVPVMLCITGLLTLHREALSPLGQVCVCVCGRVHMCTYVYVWEGMGGGGRVQVRGWPKAKV